MLDMTTTTCQNNDLRIRESLAKAERYHALTRPAAVSGRPAQSRISLRLPKISLALRLPHRSARPA